MSDLRDALDREGERFVLPPGALERMLDRRRRKTQRRRMTAVVVGLAITGVSVWVAMSLGGLGPDKAPPPPAHSPAPAGRAARLEGTWRSDRLSERDVVRRFMAAGGTAREGRDFFSQLGGGAEHYAVITLRFEGGTFLQFESGDGSAPQTGYSATYRVSPSGVLSLASPRCTGTYTFRASGGRLALQVVKQCARHDGVYNSTLFASFPFTKVG